MEVIKKFRFHSRYMLPVFFLTLTTSLYSQKAMSFKDAEKEGLRITQLDSLYKSGLHADSTKAVFGNQPEKFIGAYRGFLQDLGSHLHSNGFVWGKETKCFNRIYFNNDGQVDYFLFNFSKGEVPQEKETIFQVLVNLFIRDHKFPLTADTKFSQCSPVKYNDKK